MTTSPPANFCNSACAQSALDSVVESFAFGPLELALLTVAGVGAGWINVLAGGGSLLTVPAMLFLGVPGPIANGTNRVAVLAQNVVSVVAFARKGYADFRLSAGLAAAAGIGAAAGASLGVGLEGVWFNRLVAATMIGVMVLMATDRGGASDERDAPSAPKRLVLGYLLMIGAGFWGGLIQIGVGFLLTPILFRVMGVDLVRTAMHKVFIVLIISIVALVIFAANVPIFWAAGAALAIGNAIGGWLGTAAAIDKGAGFIKKVFLAALGAIVVKLVFFS
ncbi:MAG: sulfite exporter TauE/SafE family protein [Pseudomonadota bacterium]